MEDRLKQDFTRRLSQCNKGEMIVIMYEIVFVYLDEAKEAHNKNDYSAYKTAIKKAIDSIDTLIHALNFAYDISKQLYSLYVYSKRALAKDNYFYPEDEEDIDGIIEAEGVLKRLYNSFQEVAKSDTSAPLMRNAQKVYAGMTYGKNDLNESYIDTIQRGFLV